MFVGAAYVYILMIVCIESETVVGMFSPLEQDEIFVVLDDFS